MPDVNETARGRKMAQAKQISRMLGDLRGRLLELRSDVREVAIEAEAYGGEARNDLIVAAFLLKTTHDLFAERIAELDGYVGVFSKLDAERARREVEQAAQDMKQAAADFQVIDDEAV